MARLPVLWLYGASGIGKTTTAWELFSQLNRAGTPTGYLDIDQLGICYAAPTSDTWAPEPASDPGRHRMKARNLDAVVANFAAAGARCLVVSGVVDVARGVDGDLVPHAALTPCRLRAGPAELGRRLAGRGRPGDDLDDARRYADDLDRNHAADPCVDTTGRGVADVVRLVRERTGGWPGPARPVDWAGGLAEPAGAPAATPGEILWVCGVTAVGKSTVGWQVYERASRAGLRTAFVDLDQIGFHRPVPAGDPGSHRLKAGNLAAIWRTYHATGARRLVVVGPVDHPDAVRTYTDALPAARITLCRLHAGPARLTERVLRRGRGLASTWGLPGDELRGQSAAHLRHVAERAVAEAEALDRAAVGDLRVDTDGQRADDLADEILHRARWL
ncbi:MAG TPA: hypothetical protein VES42_03465 [Pilimelia sp.]|nr:hypothetical protein [Pilimelia sp.]